MSDPTTSADLSSMARPGKVVEFFPPMQDTSKPLGSGTFLTQRGGLPRPPGASTAPATQVAGKWTVSTCKNGRLRLQCLIPQDTDMPQGIKMTAVAPDVTRVLEQLAGTELSRDNTPTYLLDISARPHKSVLRNPKGSSNYWITAYMFPKWQADVHELWAKTEPEETKVFLGRDFIKFLGPSRWGGIGQGRIEVEIKHGSESNSVRMGPVFTEYLSLRG